MHNIQCLKSIHCSGDEQVAQIQFILRTKQEVLTLYFQVRFPHLQERDDLSHDGFYLPVQLLCVDLWTLGVPWRMSQTAGPITSAFRNQKETITLQ